MSARLDAYAKARDCAVWLARRSQRNAPHPSPEATTISVTGFWSALRPEPTKLVAGTAAGCFEQSDFTACAAYKVALGSPVIIRPQTGFNIQFSIGASKGCANPPTRRCSERLPMAVGFGA